MRSRKKNKLTKRKTGRVAAANARAVRFHSENQNALHGLLKLVTPARYKDYSNVQDYRFFNPDPYPVPVTRSGIRAAVGVGPSVSHSSRPRQNSSLFSNLSPRVVFTQPRDTLVCIRRQRRKEVIHARGVAGSRVARPKFNDLSKLHCK